ncbi:MAG TPA: hypothetical protein VLA56_17645 [Pseudomonadales bacterium]|nr:hypothetical protein [Pseudomonadales bacterium]
MNSRAAVLAASAAALVIAAGLGQWFRTDRLPSDVPERPVANREHEPPRRGQTSTSTDASSFEPAASTVLASLEAAARTCRDRQESLECQAALDDLFGGLPTPIESEVGGVAAPTYQEVFADIPAKLARVRDASRQPDCSVAADEFRAGGAPEACASRDMSELAVAQSICTSMNMDEETDPNEWAAILRQMALLAQSQEEYARRTALADRHVLLEGWRGVKCDSVRDLLPDAVAQEWFLKAAQLGDPFAASSFARVQLMLINRYWAANAPEGELEPQAVPVVDRMHVDTETILHKLAEADPVSGHAQLAWFIAEHEPRVTGEFIDEDERIARQIKAMTHLLVAERLDRSGRIDADEIRKWIVGYAPDLHPNDMSLAVHDAGLIIEQIQK